MSGDEEDGCGMIGWMKDVHGHDAHTARPCIYIPAASLAIILDIMTFWEIWQHDGNPGIWTKNVPGHTYGRDTWARGEGTKWLLLALLQLYSMSDPVMSLMGRWSSSRCSRSLSLAWNRPYGEFKGVPKGLSWWLSSGEAPRASSCGQMSRSGPSFV